MKIAQEGNRHLARVEKTVFISYRRTNASWALAIYQDLTQRGYDVFFDFKGIASGDFESIILENVRSRAHFLVLLTPSALKRCSDAGDWFRREIETAIEAKRNIVPVMLPGFKFSTPTIAQQLTGNLKPLSQYNALNVPADYFSEAMERLREVFLNVALDSVSHPASLRAQNAARIQQTAAGAAPAARKERLTAEAYFERGFSAMDPNEKIRLYTEAIRLKPDLKGAVADYEATALAATDLKQSKAQGASETVSSAPSRQKANHQREGSISDLDSEKKPDVRSEDHRLFKEPKKLKRAMEPARKKRPHTPKRTERRVVEPSRRKHTPAPTRTKPVAGTKRGEGARAGQKERRVSQNLAAEQVLSRIRSERRVEAERRRLEKEKPLQAWLNRLLNRAV